MKLPEKRSLPDPDRMLTSILEEPEEISEPVQPVWGPNWLMVAAAAVVGIVVGGGAVYWFWPAPSPVDPAGQVTATPTGEPMPSTPSPSASATPAPVPGPETLDVGDTASFEYFDVTVQDFEQDGGLFTFQLKTCVRAVPPEPASVEGRVPVGLGPWTARTSGWRTVVESSIVTEQTDFPVDQTLAPGECVDGAVTASVRERNTEVSELEYENSLGDRAVWVVR